MVSLKKKINICEFIHNIEQRLSKILHNEITRNQYAWWLVEGITGKSQSRLIFDEKVYLSDQELQKLDDWIYKLCIQQIPLQYILGKIPFLELELFVEPPILIPRPETEEWVYRVIHELKAFHSLPLRIADVGTGSGCIALACAQAFLNGQVTALDINPHALELAQRNAKHNSITNIHFMESDILSNCHELFDIIVSNPPYINEAEYKELDISVSTWEDKRALMAEDNGLAIIKQVLAQAPTRLQSCKELITTETPNIFIEISYKQGPAVVELMKAQGIRNIHLYKDLFGNDRSVQGTVDHVVDKKTSASTDNDSF